jgi:GR25 family glycosyltransferase involved in LPS biosynthesis
MKGFVIVKKNDVLSNKMADECILSGKDNGIIIQKFYGIYDDIFDQLTAEKLFVNPEALKKVTTPGVIGCFLSHYFLWKKCIEINEPIAIFEYDALVINRIDESLLTKFDDYLNLDYARHLYLKNIEVYESHLKTNVDNIFIKVLEPDVRGIGYKFMNRNHIKGAFGYIIKPSGAEKIIFSVKRDGIVPADVALNLSYTNVSYTEPSVVRLHPDMLRNKAKLSHTSNI